MNGVGRLIVENTDLVEREAARMYRRLRLVERDDLLGDGNVALVRAARRYRSEHGVPFRAFARRRIRGSMLDAVRRAVRSRHVDGALVQLASLDDPALRHETQAPCYAAAAADRHAVLELLGALPEREREVLIRIRIGGDSHRQVADELGLTTSLVAKLARRADARLRIERRRQVA